MSRVGIWALIRRGEPCVRPGFRCPPRLNGVKSGRIQDSPLHYHLTGFL